MAEEVFGGECEMFPNVTLALKAIAQAHRARGVTRCAYLPPLYGSTVTMLRQVFPDVEAIDFGDVCATSGGCSSSSLVAALTEDGATITKALSAAHAEAPFTLLFADQVASLSGRILDTEAVVGWCRENGVACILDGTQSADFNLAVWPETYVVGSQKWLCNVKTCAIVRTEEGALPPNPCAFSFGYPNDAHIWSGCLDYVPFIVLQKALRIHQAHGQALRESAAALLRENLPRVGPSALPQTGADRTMELVKVHRFEEDPQATLNAAGVYASVKRIGGECFVRVSAYPYNKPEDFTALADVLNYNHRLDAAIAGTDLSPLHESRQKRADIERAFQTTFDITDRLFENLTTEAYFTRSEPLRHPLIFYFGHSAVFFMNKLILGQYLPVSARVDAELESLCAVGVDEMSWDDLWLGNWDKVPKEEQADTVARIRAYRAKVREIVTSLIRDEERAPLTLPIAKDSLFWVIMMGIEHERIHIETSSCILTRMPIHLVQPSPYFPVCRTAARAPEDAPPNELVPVEGGAVSIGRKWDGTRFYGWDNEFGTPVEKELRDFEVSKMLVSNAEFKEFIEAGGYDTERYWTAEGWAWRKWETCNWTGEKRSQPIFWLPNGQLRTLVREIPMPWDWPAEVNNLEAAAFCAWKSEQLGRTVRLLSHPEWLHLRRQAGGVHNINMREFCSGCPVDTYGDAIGKDGEQIFDIAGNAWQHSCSPLTVLPDFSTHHLYDDFSVPTIDGQHDFILGGSWASLGNESRDDARYGFRRHFHQFAGIRYVVSDNAVEECPAPVFEPVVGKLLSEHYLDFEDPVLLREAPVPNGPAALGAAAADLVREGDRVLVLQGGPGRTTLEILARHPTCKITHTDPTALSLDALLSAQKNGTLRWERQLEGKINATETFDLPQQWVDALQGAHLDVLQIDVWKDLPGKLSEGYDVIVADLSTLGRIDWPARGQIPPGLRACANPGARLMLLAPEGNAAQPEGFQEVGERRSFAHMARDTRRKHVHAVSQLSVWQLGESAESAAARAAEQREAGAPNYESSSVVDAYLKMHFEDPANGVPNFAAACAQVCLDACVENEVPLRRALDAGCGPGRIALDLAQHFDKVLAFDFSKAFAEICRSRAPANLSAFVGNACAMGDCEEIAGKSFDLIVGANLVDRLDDPMAWIRKSKEMLSEEGVFVIISPFTWLESVTPEAKWLGGVRKDSEVHYSLHGVVHACLPELELCTAPTHLPFTIADPDGTTQYTYAQVLVFRRKRDGRAPDAFLKADDHMVSIGASLAGRKGRA
jgi:5-histidylcysteine sulfoxide synthase